MKPNAYFIQKIVTIFIFLVAPHTAFNISCYASDSDVHIYGAVTDESGHVLSDVSVTFSSEYDTFTALTNPDGRYDLYISLASTSVDNSSVPQSVILHQNYPNPFNPSTTISYALDTQTYVKLDIYNITGQFVNTLHDGYKSAGNHAVLWNGQDEMGKPVASGIYFYRIQTDRTTQIKKMLLLDSAYTNGSRQYKPVALNSQEINIAQIYYDIIVEKTGYETYTETEFLISDAIQEIRKDFIIEELEESYIFHFKTTHFYDWFYVIGDTIDIRLVSSSDLILNPTVTASLPNSVIINLTTKLGDKENIKLQKSDELYVSYFDKCGELPDYYLQSLQGMLISIRNTTPVNNNSILEVNYNDTITVSYITDRQNYYYKEIPIVPLISYTYKNMSYEYFNGMWYSVDSFVYNDRFGVKFIENATEEEINTLNNNMEVTIIEKLNNNRFILSVPNGSNSFEMINKYNEETIVDWAEIEGGGCHIIPGKI